MSDSSRRLPDWLWNALQESPHQLIRFPYEGQWVEMRVVEDTQDRATPQNSSKQTEAWIPSFSEKNPSETPPVWGEAASTDVLSAMEDGALSQVEEGEDTHTELEVEQEALQKALPEPLQVKDPIHENPPPGFEKAPGFEKGPEFPIHIDIELAENIRSTKIVALPQRVDDLDSLLPIDNNATAVLSDAQKRELELALGETGEMPEDQYPVPDTDDEEE